MQPYPVLEVTADVDGDGSPETGVFDLVGNVEVVEGIRTGYIVGGGGGMSTISNVLITAFEGLGLIEDGEARRKSITLDLGDGQHVFDVVFKGWNGGTLADGSEYRWGDQSEPAGTIANATGEPPTTQMSVFMNYLRVGRTDSLQPASLTFGEYAPDGIITRDTVADNHLDVAIEEPQIRRSAREQNEFDGSLTLVETQTIDGYMDAVARKEQ